LAEVLYWSETWSLSLRDEYILAEFENRVLKRMTGSKKEDILGAQRKPCNGDLYNF
jgi:hypothetical protein